MRRYILKNKAIFIITSIPNFQMQSPLIIHFFFI
jgi:hypothetical protein